jgi:hypothetical protein
MPDIVAPADARPEGPPGTVPGSPKGPPGAPEHAPSVGAPMSRVIAMTTWEYLTAPLLIHNTKQILDNFGADGWELVQIVNGPDGTSLVAYFKRPKTGGN